MTAVLSSAAPRRRSRTKRGGVSPTFNGRPLRLDDGGGGGVGPEDLALGSVVPGSPNNPLTQQTANANAATEQTASPASQTPSDVQDTLNNVQRQAPEPVAPASAIAEPPTQGGQVTYSGIAGMQQMMAQPLSNDQGSMRPTQSGESGAGLQTAARFDSSGDPALHAKAIAFLQSKGIQPDANGVYDFSSANKNTVNDFWERHYSDYLSKAPKTQLQAAAAYKHSELINYPLRSAAANGQNLKGLDIDDRAQIMRMDGLFSKAPGLPVDTRLYRDSDHVGTLSAFTSGKIGVGDTYMDSGFMSTTTNSSYGGGRRIKYVITAPAGTRALDMEGGINDVAGHPYGTTEREMLLPRGSRFRVDKIDNKDNPTFGNPIVIHMTMIPS